MFDTNISTYKSFNSEPVTITLARWVRSTMNPSCKYADKVQAYRNTGNEQIKKTLPHATVSAICQNGRKKDDVIQRTGWIALDIDAKDNPEIKYAANLRDQIAKIVYVAFAGLSVSGNGVWALVKVEQPQKQERYFQRLQKDFEHFDITLDSTKGQNPNDARFYSYDPNAYKADGFKIYDRLPKQYPASKPQLQTDSTIPTGQSPDTQSKVEVLISKIHTRRLDITSGYDNWSKLGFALEDEFGESGRKYFHSISPYHPDYNQSECDRQFTNCIEHDGSGIGIGTFFYVCRKYGITLDPNHNPQADSGLEANSESEDSAPYGFNPYTGEVFDERGYPSSWDEI